MTTLNSSPSQSTLSHHHRYIRRGMRLNIPTPFEWIIAAAFGALVMACIFILIARNAERENRRNDAAFLRAIQIASADLEAGKYAAVMRDLQVLTQATAGDPDRIDMVNQFSCDTIIGIVGAIDPKRGEQMKQLMIEDGSYHAH